MPFSSRPAASWRLEKPGRREEVTARTSTTRSTLASLSASNRSRVVACSYPMVNSGLAVIWRSWRQALDQRHGGSRRAHLSLVDEIDEHVARHLRKRVAGIDARQIVRLAATRPNVGALRPSIERLGGIGGRDVVLALLQTRIDEIGGHVRNARIGRVLGIDDSDRELAQERDELRGAEAVMAHFDDVAQLQAVRLRRQQLEKGAEVRRLELLERRELPEQRPEPVAELGHARADEALDRIAGLAQHPAVGREAGGLDREHEAVRHLARPLAEAFWLLRAVIGGVDLDRGEMLAGVAELLRLREAFRIEHAPPGRKIPPPDADADRAEAGCHYRVIREPLNCR